MDQIEAVEKEYGNIEYENKHLRKQIKEFENQFEQAILRIDERDAELATGAKIME